MGGVGIEDTPGRRRPAHDALESAQLVLDPSAVGVVVAEFCSAVRTVAPGGRVRLFLPNVQACSSQIQLPWSRVMVFGPSTKFSR